MVKFPPGEPQEVCAICGEPFEQYAPEFASGYANLVCVSCDERAVTGGGEEPTVGPHDGQGDNPVYIDGIKCWRRIRFGGHITREMSSIAIRSKSFMRDITMTSNQLGLGTRSPTPLAMTNCLRYDALSGHTCDHQR